MDDIVAAKQSQAEKVCPGLDVWSHVKCAVPLLNNKKVAKDRKANSLMATLSLIYVGSQSKSEILAQQKWEIVTYTT